MLEDVKINVKIKLSVLWLFVVGSLLAGSVIFFMVPGVIDEIRVGEIVGMQATDELLLIMAIIYFWIPLVMAVMSISLKGIANRWLNIVLGVVYAGFILFELTMNIISDPYPYVILMDTSAFIAAALIVWYAWKWPKQEA